jgi:hypothetical protein
MKRKVWWQVTVVLNIENLARPSSSSNPFDNEGYRCRRTRAPQIKSYKPSEKRPLSDGTGIVTKRVA